MYWKSDVLQHVSKYIAVKYIILDRGNIIVYVKNCKYRFLLELVVNKPIIISSVPINKAKNKLCSINGL